MKFRHPDLNLLLALEVILSEKSVTRAGERLFRTQSAMSGILARLRQYFNDDLLIQVGNTTELTPLASELIPSLKEFLALAQQIAEFKPNLDPVNLEHMFVLAMSDYVADFIMPGLLGTLAIQAPNVRIRIRTLDYDYEDEVERRQIDFVIVPKEYWNIKGYCEEVIVDRWVCIANSNRYGSSNVLSLEDFENAKILTVTNNHGFVQPAFERRFGDMNLNWSAVARVPYFQMLPRIVAHTDYLAIIHGRTALRDATSFGLKIFEIPAPLEPIKLSLCMHERNNHSQPHQWMKGILSDECAKLA